MTLLKIHVRISLCYIILLSKDRKTIAILRIQKRNLCVFHTHTLCMYIYVYVIIIIYMCVWAYMSQCPHHPFFRTQKKSYCGALLFGFGLQVRGDVFPHSGHLWCAVENVHGKSPIFWVKKIHGKIMKNDMNVMIFIGDMLIGYTLWLFNIAMGNSPFIDGLPIKNGDFPWLC